MKKIWKYFVAFAAVLLTYASTAQTLEHAYYYSHKEFWVTDIGNNDYKYVFEDSTGVKIYNLDHSLYFNIIPPIQLFQAPSYYEIMYITKSLFDCDSTNLEYVISASLYDGNFYVYRADGTLLFERDSVAGPYCFGCQGGSTINHPITNTPNGAKLFLFTRPNSDSLYIYGLCGTLPEIVDDIHADNKYVQVFPNPSNGIINFSIHFPNNFERFKLTLYDESFNVIDESIVNENYQFDTRNRSLSSGIYLFDLRSQDKVYQTGKFIISK